MTTRIGIALGFVLSLSSSPACEHEDSCDVHLDDGKLEDRVCDAVALIVECYDKRGVDADDENDAALKAALDECDAEFTWCSIDPTVQGFPVDVAFDELRGTSNDCVG